MRDAGDEASGEPAPDLLYRFRLEAAAARGVLVRLGPAWREIRAQTAYPPIACDYLAQALAAAALFAGNIGFAARVAVQLRAGGGLRMVLAECGEDGAIRGVARFDPERALPRSLAELGAGALLSITVEQTGTGLRQQGLVPLEGDGLSAAFEHYFAQSEQLPTRVRLLADGERCAGALLQQLARTGGRALRHETVGFERASAQFGTLTAPELATLPVERLLTRLFPDDDIRLEPPRRLGFGCSCSLRRVEAMLRALGRDEVAAAAAATGQVEVQCEFCHRRYTLAGAALDRLFADDPAATPGGAADGVTPTLG